MTEKERLVKDRLLLEKERELMQRQASEIRDECQRMQERYTNTDKKVRINGVNSPRSKQHAVQDFIDPENGDGYATLLRDAITFCETYDGCPFYGVGCKSDEATGCRGIWIKMGATCRVFADSIKLRIKEAIGNGK